MMYFLVYQIICTDTYIHEDDVTLKGDQVKFLQ